MATGKSPLAQCLAADLGCGLIETDNFSIKLLHPERLAEDMKDRPYVNCLDLEAIADRFAAELDNHPLLVIEGICLRDTLAKIGQAADLFVYVKCVSRSSRLWHDGFHLEDYEADPTLVRGLHRDELEYHGRTRPHDCADLVLVRFEETPGD